MMNPAIEKIVIEGIVVPERHRAADMEAVKVLAESIAKIGLRTPITVRLPNDYDCVLVAGLHRLEAAKLLGWEKIDCFVLECSEDEAEMWEIGENLHRAELTVLQRSEQVARWTELADRVSAQVGPKPQGGRPESGVRKAARDLNLDRKEVDRAVKIAGLTPEAKAAAAKRGLDDNQSALLEAARHKSPEKQVAAIVERAEKKKEKKPEVQPSEILKQLKFWWSKASDDERASFMAFIRN